MVLVGFGHTNTKKKKKKTLLSLRWHIQAKCKTHEAVVQATCPREGTPLRAPTKDRGLSPFCRDSFFGQVLDHLVKSVFQILGG